MLENRLMHERLRTLEAKLEDMTTELERQSENEHQLYEANASKDKFFSIIAHDLRNPLNVLLLTAEFLDTDYDEYDASMVKTYISNILTSARRLSDLLENLLNWSRNQTHQIRYLPETHDLAVLCRQSSDIIAANAKAKQIELVCSVPRGWFVFCDSNMISTVLRNLLSNAVKFTDMGGRVDVSAQRDTDIIKVLITDNGRGIEPENMVKMFRVGQQFSTQGTSDEQGTGLGLVLCKEFVEKNDGKIGVTSTPGQGTTFWFTLPADFTFEEYSQGQ